MSKEGPFEHATEAKGWVEAGDFGNLRWQLCELDQSLHARAQERK
jgi:hypothetical protein